MSQEASSRGLLGVLRGIPAQLWLRMALLVALVAAGFALVRFTPLGDYLTVERMTQTLEGLRSWPWTPALLIGLYAVLAPLALPMTPLVVGGGVVFGPVVGSFYNILGLVLGAMSSFYVGKVLGREFVVHLGGPRLRRAERVFHRRGFWPLVQVRFIPVPFWAVSYAAAMAGVKAPRFLATSAIGLVPATVMHTFFSSRLVLHPSPATFAQYMAAWGTFALVTGWPTFRQSLRRRRRYRELTEQRRARLSMTDEIQPRRGGGA